MHFKYTHGSHSYNFALLQATSKTTGTGTNGSDTDLIGDATNGFAAYAQVNGSMVTWGASFTGLDTKLNSIFEDGYVDGWNAARTIMDNGFSGNASGSGTIKVPKRRDSYSTDPGEDTYYVSGSCVDGKDQTYVRAHVEIRNYGGTLKLECYSSADGVTTWYDRGWADAIATVSMDSCTVSRYDTWGHATNTVRGRARCKYKATPNASDYSYSSYLDSTNSVTASANYTDTHSASLSGSASLSISGGMTLYNGKKYGYQDGSFTTNGTTYYIMSDVHTLGGDSGTENWYRYSNIGISDTHSASLSGDISVWIDWS